MNKSYILANRKQNTDNKLVSSFKNSFLGADIGLKSENFTTIIFLSTILATGTIFLMYYFWRV